MLRFACRCCNRGCRPQARAADQLGYSRVEGLEGGEGVVEEVEEWPMLRVAAREGSGGCPGGAREHGVAHLFGCVWSARKE